MSAQAWNAQQHLAAEYLKAVETEEMWAGRLDEAYHRGDEFQMRVSAYWHGLAAMERAQIARDYYTAATGRKLPQRAGIAKEASA